MVRRAALLMAIALLTQAATNVKPPAQLKVLILAPPNATLRSVDDVQATVLGSTAPAEIVRLATPDQDLILMLVLDLAGDVSMAHRAKDALAVEMEQLPSTVHVALLRAQDDLRVILDPTRDREAVQTAIRSTPVSGRAALLNTVETAATLGDAVLAKSDVTALAFVRPTRRSRRSSVAKRNDAALPVLFCAGCCAVRNESATARPVHAN